MIDLSKADGALDAQHTALISFWSRPTAMDSGKRKERQIMLKAVVVAAVAVGVAAAAVTVVKNKRYIGD